ncbi:uncharacterized protein LOC135500488 [Lineus longissimus]|uniref:uncharacterized protein LOC135500488 n=1 Tax=Lineus longissimus TaxID=88925 RepID=UPI002B4C6387
MTISVHCAGQNIRQTFSFEIKMHVLVTIVSLLFVAVTQGQKSSCTQDGPCKCTFSDGTIDLTPLTPSGTAPKWKDIAPTGGGDYVYSFNPCKDFTETDPSAIVDDCKGVASCQKGNYFSAYYSCGRQSSATFIEAGGKIKLQFKETTTTPERHTEVTLVCSTSESFVVNGEKSGSSPPLFEYTLSSPHACKGGGGGGGGSGAISVGTVLCIVLLVVILVYVIGGVTFMAAVKKVRGPEMIPNVSFWKALPGYVRDGCCFSVSPITKKSDYGKI